MVVGGKIGFIIQINIGGTMVANVTARVETAANYFGMIDGVDRHIQLGGDDRVKKRRVAILFWS